MDVEQSLDKLIHSEISFLGSEIGIFTMSFMTTTIIQSMSLSYVQVVTANTTENNTIDGKRERSRFLEDQRYTVVEN
jgi:hypothetical protein